jgi:hypothetical protein
MVNVIIVCSDFSAKVDIFFENLERGYRLNGISFYFCRQKINAHVSNSGRKENSRADDPALLQVEGRQPAALSRLLFLA